MNYKFLQEISENLDSMRKPVTSKNRTAGNIPYYGASGIVDHVDTHIFDEELLLISEDGANLVMRNYPIAFSISGKTWVNNHAHVLRFKDKTLQKYVEIYLNSIDLTPYITGTAQPKLNQKLLNSIPIPVYDNKTISKIVSVLDTLDRIITLRKKQLEECDLLVKARFEELNAQWSDAVSPKPLCNYLDSITYGFTNPMPDSDDGPWKITAKDVVNGQVNLSTARKTTQEAYNDLTEKSKPIKGDVLLTKDGTLGRVAIVNENNICVNQSVAVLRPNKRIISIFLSQLLQMPIYQREMLKNAGGGTIKHIYITKVDKMRILVPPINQQQQFAAFVAQTDKTKAAVQQVLSKAETLKKALMQEYFG